MPSRAARLRVRALLLLLLVGPAAALLGQQHRGRRKLRSRAASLSPSPPLDNLVDTGVVRQGFYTCLDHTAAEGHSRNRWFQPSNKSSPPAPYLPGTTYWYNEWLALGHAPLELAVIPVALSTPLERVVVQRVLRGHLLRSWEAWFEGYFQSLRVAGRADFAVYLRYDDDTKHWHSYPKEGPNGTSNKGTLPASGVMCFEHVLQSYGGTDRAQRISRHDVIVRGINREVRNRFLEAAFTCAGAGAAGLEPRGVLLSLRPSDREMSNAEELVERLRRESNGLPVTVWKQSYATSFAEQLKLVAGAQVVVASHGAFETNLIWLKPEKGVFLELRGTYMRPFDANPDGATATFRALADAFAVKLMVVTVAGLRSHRQPSYVLSGAELERVSGSVALALSR